MLTMLRNLGVAALLTLSTPLLAQELAPEASARIEERIAAFDDVMIRMDMAATFDFVPPKLKKKIAESFGIPVEDLKSAMASALDEAMKTVKFESFGMDFAAATISTTTDGSRTYALIPTETLMSVEGAGKIRATSQTLAMDEGGEWYLVRVDDASQTTILKQVYPEFADVDFPLGQMVPAE
jgi:hypothetical protein